MPNAFPIMLFFFVTLLLCLLLRSFTSHHLYAVLFFPGSFFVFYLAGGEISFFSTPEHPDRLWSPPSLLLNGHRDFFAWGKAAWGGVANTTPPSSTEVLNECNCTSAI